MAWISRRKEQKVLRMLEEHMAYVLKTVEGLRKATYAFCDGNEEGFKEGYKEVFDGEGEADSLKRKILDELSKGMFHPVDRDEIIRFVLTADDIASNAKGAAVRMTFIPLALKDEGLKGGLKKLADDLVRIAIKTKEAVEKLIENPKGAVEKAHEVEEIEEQIDDFRRDLLRTIMRSYDSLGTVKMLCLKEIVDSMENVADKCEDVADLIRSIVIVAV